MSLDLKAFTPKGWIPGSANAESDMYVFLIIKDVAIFLSKKIALIHISNQKCTRVPTSSLAAGIIGPPFSHLISVNSGLAVTLLPISLIAPEFQPLFMHVLVTRNCCSVNYLFTSLAQFSVAVFIPDLLVL